MIINIEYPDVLFKDTFVIDRFRQDANTIILSGYNYTLKNNLPYEDSWVNAFGFITGNIHNYGVMEKISLLLKIKQSLEIEPHYEYLCLVVNAAFFVYKRPIQIVN